MTFLCTTGLRKGAEEGKEGMTKIGGEKGEKRKGSSAISAQTLEMTVLGSHSDVY